MIKDRLLITEVVQVEDTASEDQKENPEESNGMEYEEYLAGGLSGDEIELDGLDETEQYLGAHPLQTDLGELWLSQEIADRMVAWTTKGMTSKEEKEKLLKSIPRQGRAIPNDGGTEEIRFNLEAPKLNEEVKLMIQPKAKDNYFREFQNLAGSIISETSSLFDMITYDAEMPLERKTILKKVSNATILASELLFLLNQSRKIFQLRNFEDKTQKVLREVESTSWLFGYNLKGVIESTTALERWPKTLRLRGSHLRTKV